MVDSTSDSRTIETGPQISFDPVRYQADGAISASSAIQLLGILGTAGVILGVIAAGVARIFYLVLLFPILIGACLGAIGSRCIRRFHIRNPFLCGLAGFIAGCVAMFAMHYTEFQMFERTLANEFGPDFEAVRGGALRRDQIRADWDNTSAEEQELIVSLEQNPEWMDLLQANTVWKYIDIRAHHGVELNRAGGGGGRGLNLGYTGSYIYWVVEALIVAGIAYFAMSRTASEPYCNECGKWKEAQSFGPFADSKRIKELVMQGALKHLADVPEDSPLDTVVTLHTCPDCQAASDVDVSVERWTVNSKGETISKKLVQMTYPGIAIPVLTAICTPNAPQQPEVSDANDASQIDGGGEPSTDDVVAGDNRMVPTEPNS